MLSEVARQSGAQHLISAAQKRWRSDHEGVLAECHRAVELDPARGEAYSLQADITGNKRSVD